MRVAAVINLTGEEHEALARLVRGRRTETRVVVRAQIVLHAAEGMKNKDIAAQLGVKPDTVGRWRSRYAAEGVDGILKDLPRGGRRPTRRSRAESEVIRALKGAISPSFLSLCVNNKRKPKPSFMMGIIFKPTER